MRGHDGNQQGEKDCRHFPGGPDGTRIERLLQRKLVHSIFQKTARLARPFTSFNDSRAPVVENQMGKQSNGDCQEEKHEGA